MPELVKRSVGSSPGTSEDERTRVWPCASKYLRNFARSSAPVIGRPIVPSALRAFRCARGGSFVGRDANRLPHHARDDPRREAAPEELVAQARRRALGRCAAERREPAPREGTRLGELVLALEGRERRVRERRGDAAGAELGAEARGAVAARGARLDPVAGERSVVHVAAAGELGHHRGRDVLRGAAAREAHGELARGPRATGEEIGRGEAHGPGVEGLPGRAYRLKKDVPAGVVTGFSSFFCSNDASPPQN